MVLLGAPNSFHFIMLVGCVFYSIIRKVNFWLCGTIMGHSFMENTQSGQIPEGRGTFIPK